MYGYGDMSMMICIYYANGMVNVDACITTLCMCSYHR